MSSIQFLATVLLLLVAQCSVAASMYGASGTFRRQLKLGGSPSTAGYDTRSGLPECVRCYRIIFSSLFSKAETQATKASFPCGHGDSIHTTCFKDLLEKSLADELECPECSAKLNVDGTLQALIGTKRQAPDNMRVEVPPSEVKLAMQKWPGIKNIGRGIITCDEYGEMQLMSCASIALEEEINAVSTTMIEYRKDPEEFFEAQMRQNVPELYNFRKFNAFGDMYHFSTLTIGDAYEISLHYETFLHYVDGTSYYQKLMFLLADIRDISASEPSRLKGYELESFSHSVIAINGKPIGTFRDAVLLMQLPSLRRLPFRMTVEYAIDVFSLTKATVKKFIKTNYPNLVKFQSIGTFESPHLTIEHYAREIMHPYIVSNIAKKELSNLEAGAKSIEHNVYSFIRHTYGNIKFLDTRMKNVPGDISLHTAIMYSFNPNLSSDEGKKWSKAIQDHFSAHGINPISNPALSDAWKLFPNSHNVFAKLTHYG